MSEVSTPVQHPNPAVIFESLNAYQRTTALKTAIELDLFTEIARGHRNPEALAKAVKASVRGVRILCDYLVLSGFLLKEGTEYTLTADASVFLDRKSQAYLGGIVGFLLNPALLAPFLNLTETVRSGTTTLPGDGTVSPDNPIWVDFAKHMAPMMYPAAEEIARLVAGEGEMRVLDIAAGHGLFGIKVAQHNRQATVTALDWPNVLAVAAANAEKAGVSGRHSLLPGDAFTSDFGGPHDLVLVTNFFHHFDQPTCEKLMRKILVSLAPGGRCVTLEFVPNEDRVSPPPAAGFALMMLGTTAVGDVYTFSEYETMFHNAGYASSEFHSLTRLPEALIVSRKG